MTTYNPNDFYPHAGQEIKSDGNTVNPADSVDTNGNQGTSINTRKQTTSQTHNQIIIAANSNSSQGNGASYLDCNGFDKIAVTSIAEAGVNATIELWWSNDNNTIHMYDQITTGTSTTKGGITDVKARYVKVNIKNLDTTNSHTFSAWAFLKD